jgi:hypothetical protein
MCGGIERPVSRSVSDEERGEKVVIVVISLYIANNYLNITLAAEIQLIVNSFKRQIPGR